MSVSSTTARIAVTVTALPQSLGTFEFNEPADLLLLDGGLSNTGIDPPVPLTLGSDYTVSGGGYNGSNQLQPGTVTLLASGSANIQVGDVITLIRNISPVQVTRFASTGLQTPLMIEQDDDTLTTLLQEVLDKINLCLRFELNETESAVLIRSARAGQLLGFDANGNISFVQAGAIVGGFSNLAITGFTGGGSTKIDGINTALFANPSLFFFVINGQMVKYVLQTSSATADGFLVITPISNSALRFIQV